MVKKKKFYVRIDLEIKAVTCPGVWLCPNGGIELSIKTLGYIFLTKSIRPYFPLICHEHFVMKGFFKCVECLADLENMFNCETIEIGMWQNGKRLAYYYGKLGKVVLPNQTMQCESETKIMSSILMTAANCFPGIISPKIEYLSILNITDIHPYDTSMSIVPLREYENYGGNNKIHLTHSPYLYSTSKIYKNPPNLRDMESEENLRIYHNKCKCGNKSITENMSETNLSIYKQYDESLNTKFHNVDSLIENNQIFGPWCLMNNQKFQRYPIFSNDHSSEPSISCCISVPHNNDCTPALSPIKSITPYKSCSPNLYSYVDKQPKTISQSNTFKSNVKINLKNLKNIHSQTDKNLLTHTKNCKICITYKKHFNLL